MPRGLLGKWAGSASAVSSARWPDWRDSGGFHGTVRGVGVGSEGVGHLVRSRTSFPGVRSVSPTLWASATSAGGDVLHIDREPALIDNRGDDS